MLEEALTTNIGFLVVGDPFGATTHSDLVIRAKDLGVEVKVIHNASVMNAVGACGLQLYSFGQTVSIVFFTETWRCVEASTLQWDDANEPVRGLSVPSSAGGGQRAAELR
jgi:diphthamide biosynthesis methyltransferase